MSDVTLDNAIAIVPAGRWAVGVSGGADSVAMLDLLRSRSDLSLHVVHLNHQARGQASDEDARFVQQLCQNWNLHCTAEIRSQLEPALHELPSNLSARFREMRLALYHRVVRERQLLGVILAHHADDQAETILHRLIRGSGVAGLAGMCFQTMLGQLRVLRPLLSVRRQTLRDHLAKKQILWREDESNQSDKYLRNRLRRQLQQHPQLIEPLLNLGHACKSVRDWARQAAQPLEDEFSAQSFSQLPRVLREESARIWLLDRGVPADQIEPETIERLLEMAGDAAVAARQDFPGKVHVRRQRGRIRTEKRS